jgi:hypothetical protein
MPMTEAPLSGPHLLNSIGKWPLNMGMFEVKGQV